MAIAAGLWSACGAVGASGTVTVRFRPDLAGRASTLRVDAEGPFTLSSRVPQSVAGLLTRGFRVDPRATPVKCSPPAGGGACPRASQIGSGEAVVNVSTSIGLGSGTYHAPFQVFLGRPVKSGDVASVVVQVSVNGQTYTGIGRLFRLARGPYGLELLAQVPKPPSPPPGVTYSASLQKLTLGVGARRKVSTDPGHRRRVQAYSLITNPPRCVGSWQGKLVETFSGGTTQSLTFAAPCRGPRRRTAAGKA